MPLLENIKADIIGIAIVIAVLFSLSVIVKLIFAVREKALRKKNDGVITEKTPEKADSWETVQYSQGELKLLDVDEKTAALIMAIVSDNSGIPLSELSFKNIRLLKS